MNEGLTLLEINALTAHPTNPDIVYAGSGGNSVFRIVAPRPASLSDLTISPREVETGDTVTVSVLVTNTGDIECTYQVQLMVDGSVEETSEVTLAGGESQTVTFTTAKDVAGIYSVTVDALSGAFTVKAAPESLVAEEEEEEPAKPTNWPVLGGLVGGAVVVVTLLVYFLALRRRST